MSKSLGGWQRIGVIGAVIWVAASPFVIGPLAKANAEACAVAAQFEPGGVFERGEPGARNPDFDPMAAASGPVFYPNPKPVACFGGFETWFDLRDYPFDLDRGTATVVAALVLLLEVGLTLLLAWAVYNVVAGVIRWVRAGFTPVDGEAKG